MENCKAHYYRHCGKVILVYKKTTVSGTTEALAQVLNQVWQTIDCFADELADRLKGLYSENAETGETWKRRELSVEMQAEQVIKEKKCRRCDTSGVPAPAATDDTGVKMPVGQINALSIENPISAGTAIAAPEGALKGENESRRGKFFTGQNADSNASSRKSLTTVKIHTAFGKTGGPAECAGWCTLLWDDAKARCLQVKQDVH